MIARASPGSEAVTLKEPGVAWGFGQPVLLIELDDEPSEALSFPEELIIHRVKGFEAALDFLRASRVAAIVIETGRVAAASNDLDRIRAAAPNVPKCLVAPLELVGELVALAEGHAFTFVPAESHAERLSQTLQQLLSPRSAFRQVVDRAGLLVTARFEGHRISGTLLDVSNSGLSFAADRGQNAGLLIPGSELADLEIRTSGNTLVLRTESVVVRRSCVEQDQLRIGGTFKLPPPAGQTPVRVITDRLPVTATLRKAIRLKAPFGVALPDSPDTETFTATLQEDGTLQLQGPPSAALAVHEAVRLSFDFHYQSYVGLVTVLDRGDDHLRVSLPRSLRVFHRRSSRRYQPQSERRYVVQFRNPFDGAMVEHPVDDINAGGLSFTLDLDRHALPPGTVLEEMALCIPQDEQPVRLTGEVRSVRPLATDGVTGRPARCGVEVDYPEKGDRDRLCEAIIKDGFPTCEFAQPDDFADIWSLFLEAGLTYHLYADGDQSSKDAVEHTFRALTGPARECAASLVYRQNGRVRGHLASFLAYSSTWLTTHLAAQTGEFRRDGQISRALVLGMTGHLETRPTCDFVKFFWKRDLRWPNRMFGWAGRGALHTGLAAIREYDLLVRRSDRSPGPPPEGVVVREARRDELALVEDLLIKRVGTLTVRSEDLSASSITLEHGAGKIFGRGGLERSRSVRLACIDDRPVALALLQYATPGIQVNEFLNAFDVYAFDDVDPEQDEVARRALINDAVRFYQARGLRHAVAMSEDRRTAPFLEEGFEFVTVFRSLLLHRSILRMFNDFFDQLFAGSGFQNASDA